MAGVQGYDVIVGIPVMKRSIPAMVTALLVFIFLLPLPASAQAQAHGMPASVTSLGFGGHGARPSGISPSVTSFGRGFAGGSSWGVRSGATSGWGNSRQFGDNPSRRFDHRRARSYYPYYPYGGYAYGGYYGAPFYYPYVGYDSPDAGTYADPADQSDDQTDDRYDGGPTIFDRRGNGRRDYAARPQDEDRSRDADKPAAPAPEPVANEPDTTLVFNDGHQLEVRNYAILGDSILDFTPGHRRKLPLSELNREATIKINEERGIDFQLPPRTN